MKAKSVSTHDFAMNPSPEVKRSTFPIRQGNTTGIDFGDLTPLFVYDVLPGDHWNAKITASCRTSVPIAPILDNWHLEFFAFFTPYRIVWTNFVKMMGEQDNPGDSISFTTPQVVSDAGGFPNFSIYDYMGLPGPGQIGGANTISVSALPLRAYKLIYTKWFRDENLQSMAAQVILGDGPDPNLSYGILKRGKRPDYFTTALPWPQKGNTAASLPLGTTAPIISTGGAIPFSNVAATRTEQLNLTTGSAVPTWTAAPAAATSGATFGPAGNVVTWANVSLSTATAATIEQLRIAITLQQLLERDARGGTRYIEGVWSHFKVKSPDQRQQRPEYIGGGTIPIVINAVPQTAQTGLTGGTTPLGTLGGTGYAIGTAGFSYAATEHGCIIVIANARADLRYSQGIDRFWSKLTRYDYFLPVLEGLGEQGILNKEIYATGAATDSDVFGYTPRWNEYRHFPSKITGIMRPSTTGNIAYWHTSENFGALPTLNNTFVSDQSATVTQRNFTAGALTENQQIFGDFMVQGSVARSMSTYGVPGLTRL